MRVAVWILAALYAAVLGWLLIDTQTRPMDAAGYGMATGFLVVGGGVVALFTGPALILTALNRAPRWALGLALVPGAIVLFFILVQFL